MAPDMIKTKRGCWTCKDRKVQCDRGLPTCQTCARVGRVCQGYGLRLSWPRPNDKRRAITGTDLPLDTQLRQKASRSFINTTWWDIELYRYLSQPGAVPPAVKIPHSPVQWKPPPSKAKHMDIVQYFHDVAYYSLVTFSPNTSNIRDVIIRMALACDTIPGTALFYAVLALSSLRRNGLHLEAIQFKLAALSALQASLKKGVLSPAEAAQHVATCMLLCTFEIQFPSESSGEWFFYIKAAMEMIQGARLEEQLGQKDIIDLVDWVHYHNAVSQFTTRHWRYKCIVMDPSNASDANPCSLFAQFKRVPRSPSPAHAILNLLSEVCETLIDPSDPRSNDEEYQDQLKTLEQRVRGLSISDQVSSAKYDADTAVSVELYQVTTLIYLVRASGSPWSSSTDLKPLIDRAFAVPLKLPTCDHFFPLFIMACEARTDEERETILAMIERTEKQNYVRSMNGIKAGIKSIWVQQDLHADGDLAVSYLRMLNAVISNSCTIPSYA